MKKKLQLLPKKQKRVYTGRFGYVEIMSIKPKSRRNIYSTEFKIKFLERSDIIGVKNACLEWDNISIRTVEKWRNKIKRNPLYYD